LEEEAESSTAEDATGQDSGVADGGETVQQESAGPSASGVTGEKDPAHVDAAEAIREHNEKEVAEGEERGTRQRPPSERGKRKATEAEMQQQREEAKRARQEEPDGDNLYAGANASNELELAVGNDAPRDNMGGGGIFLTRCAGAPDPEEYSPSDSESEDEGAAQPEPISAILGKRSRGE